MPSKTSALGGLLSTRSWAVREALLENTLVWRPLLVERKQLQTKSCPYWCGHRGVIQPAVLLEYIVNGPELGKRHVCNGYHHYVFHSMQNLEQLVNVIKLQPTYFPPFFVFTGHGYVRNDDMEYYGNQNMRSSGNSMRDTIRTVEVICFLNSESFAVSTRS